MKLCATLLCNDNLFGASSHPYIPFHLKEKIFPLVQLCFVVNCEGKFERSIYQAEVEGGG